METRRTDGAETGIVAEQNRRLAEQAAELAREKTLADLFVEAFDAAYYVDLRTREAMVCRWPQSLPGARQKVEDYQEFLKEYVRREVHPDDRGLFHEASRPEVIRARLEGEKEYSVRYREIGPDGGIRYYQCRVARGMDAEHVAVCFLDETERMQAERERDAGRAAAQAGSEAMARALGALHREESLENLHPFLEIVRDWLGAANCCIVEIDEGAGVARVDGRYDLGCEGATTPERWEMKLEGWEGWLWQLKGWDALRLNAAEAARLWRAYGVPEEEIRTDAIVRITVVPIPVHGKLWGALNVAFRREEGLADELNLRNLKRIAEVLGAAIERRDTYEELRTALERAKAAERAKATFLATMSHEIRTPLNAVIGFADFLQGEGVTDAEKARYLAGIKRSSMALLSLINDILDLSKLEAGKMEMKGGASDVRRLFAEMEAIFQYQVGQKGLTLRLTVGEGMPAAVALREERLRQILLNLVGNSVKFTQKGEVIVEGEWTETGGGRGRLGLTVKDTGPGISESKWETIFDPFAQDGSVRGGKVYQGTGLGLPICKRLVELLGGTITVGGKVNHGAEFRVEIPDVERAEASAAEADAKGKAAGDATAGLGSVRAFLVDDVPMNLMILAKYVERAGVPKENIETYMAARDALEDLRKKRAELTAGGVHPVLLTDLWMPKMTGPELAAAVKGEKGLEGMPIVAVTADAEATGSFDMSLFGRVLTKPITGENVKAALAWALGGGEAGKE